jgi:hypothetical protein
MGTRPGDWEGRWRPDLLVRIAYVLFVLATCWLVIHWLQGSINNYLPKDWSRAHEYDGLEDWLAARFYLAGKNPYTPASLAQLNRIGLGHPPTTGFWFIPLGYLTKAIVAEVVDLTTWFLLVVHLYLCARAVKVPAPIAVTALIFAWVFTTDGLSMHWHAIQLSEQIAFLLVLGWLYLRAGREVPAGIALGLAATLKLFPGVLILFLLLARRYRAFVIAGAVYVGVAAFMTATYGFSAWPLFLEEQSGISHVWVGSIRNASLHGIVLRLLSPICVASVLGSTRGAVISAFGGVLLLALGVRVSYQTVKRARYENPRLIDLPFAMFTLLAVFVNPWIWEHYSVLLIQPTFVLVAAVLRTFSRSLRGWLDQALPGRGVIQDGSVLLLVLGAVAVSAFTLRLNIFAKMALEDIWRHQPSPWYHRQLHLMEILNWLPWVTMVIVSLFTAWYLAPGRGQAAHAVAPPAGHPAPPVAAPQMS